MIPLVYETDAELSEFGGIVEACAFCQAGTRYWHENTNNPVCQSCAKTYRVSELKDWGKAIRAAKRKKAQQGKAVGDE